MGEVDGIGGIIPTYLQNNKYLASWLGLVGWLAACLAAWSGWVAGWLTSLAWPGWLLAWLAGCLAWPGLCWLAGWPPGCLPGLAWLVGSGGWWLLNNSPTTTTILSPSHHPAPRPHDHHYLANRGWVGLMDGMDGMGGWMDGMDGWD